MIDSQGDFQEAGVYAGVLSNPFSRRRGVTARLDSEGFELTRYILFKWKERILRVPLKTIERVAVASNWLHMGLVIHVQGDPKKYYFTPSDPSRWLQAFRQHNVTITDDGDGTASDVVIRTSNRVFKRYAIAFAAFAVFLAFVLFLSRRMN